MFSETVKARVRRSSILRPLLLFRRSIRRRALEHRLARFRELCVRVGELTAKPLFVKVGANDGITGDPCSDILISSGKWTGVLIEPVPHLFEKLKANFPDSKRFILEQSAIGSTRGVLPFYYVSPAAKEKIPNLPTWSDQLGSFNRNHIVGYLNGILEPFICQMDIKVETLADVLDRHGIGAPHLLHVDTEGYDYEVLKSLDLATRCPPIIFIEHNKLKPTDKKAMLSMLKRNGFSVYDCGSDYFAVDKKAVKRMAKDKPRH